MHRDLDRPLSNIRVLVAEDEFYIADDLAKALRTAGAVPVGPVSTTAEAEELLRNSKIDAAILDMNLRGELAIHLAVKVQAMMLPCLIVSGYSKVELPEAVASLPRLEKPIDCKKVVDALVREIDRRLEPL